MKRLFAYSLIATILFSLTIGSAPALSQSKASGLPMAKPEEVGMSSERLARVRVAMQRYVDKGLVPGVVTMVARSGKVVHLEAIGSRDVENKQPMTTDTIVRIASMTKPIASVALMMLYEEGHFLLSDPIAKLLPEFTNMKVAVPASGEDRIGTPYKLVPAAASHHVQTRADAHRRIRQQLSRNHVAGIHQSRSTRPQAQRHHRRRGQTVGDLATELSSGRRLGIRQRDGCRWPIGRSHFGNDAG
jgi:hypothetical protein